MIYNELSQVSQASLNVGARRDTVISISSVLSCLKATCKVQILGEGHKISSNLPLFLENT